MSGLCGIIHNNDGPPVDRQLLNAMTSFMTFRGPDVQNVWLDGQVGFGHTLLRTTFESEHEQQPICLDGRYWITADARIDGQTELKRKLAGKEYYPAETAPDAELILLAYRAWGESCLEHLIGDFAFAIWDSENKTLFCARDHFGVKPFYYSETASGFIFSNTLNCLRKHPEVSATLNDRAIGDFLLFDYNCDPGTTTFTDIQRLPAAHYLTWSDGKLRVNRYWTLPIPDQIRYRHDSEYIGHFRELLREAVRDRLRTDRVAVSMSGGLDSTCIAATASELLKGSGRPFDLRAQTVVYDRLIPDRERYYSTLAAEGLGIPIRHLAADDHLLFDKLEHPGGLRPEPATIPDSAISVDELRHYAEYDRVVLTGWDGDAILAESPRPYLHELMKGLHYWRLAASVAWLLSHRPRQLTRSFILRLKWLLGEKKPSRRASYPEWINPGFEQRIGLKDRWLDLNNSSIISHPTRPYALQILTSQDLWLDLFECYDPGVTGSALEFRHPLLDLRLIDFCLSLPPIPWCTGKELIRRTIYDNVPKLIVSRPKEPLAGLPWMEKLKYPESAWLEHINPAGQLAEYVDCSAIPRLATEADPSRAWSGLRPASLGLWLNASI